MATIGRMVRQNMRPDTEAQIRERMAHKRAAEELRTEFDNRLETASVQGAEAVTAVVQWYKEAHDARVIKLLRTAEK